MLQNPKWVFNSRDLIFSYFYPMTKIAELLKQLLRFLNLDTELVDFETIHESFEKGIIFKGTNLWILIFAILIASIGLNMNSTAVIIGAMLISPLMGPINGIGYSVATYNIHFLKRSLKNFLFAVIASIITSYVYFLLTPVSNAQSELLARTSPTIFDVLIALFGGFAGIVAICSKNKGNVLPGVAIATALMPPLCTVGYGLAVGNSTYFFGALYLFTINSVFIALSSMIVSQILKFPKNTFITSRFKKLANVVLFSLVFITVVPSVYLGYTLAQKEKFLNNSTKYVEEISAFENNYLLKYNINSEKRIIQLIYGGDNMSTKQHTKIKKKALSFGLDNTLIDIKQGLKMKSFTNEFNEVDNLKQEIQLLLDFLPHQSKKIDSLERLNDFGNQLFKEVKVFYPELQSLSYSKTKEFTNDTVFPITLIRFQFKNSIIKKNEAEITEWLNKRLSKDSIVVYFDEN